MQGGTVQVAVFPVDEQGGSGGGEKEEQVDALGGPLVHVKKQCHHQQQQRPAAMPQQQPTPRAAAPDPLAVADPFAPSVPDPAAPIPVPQTVSRDALAGMGGAAATGAAVGLGAAAGIASNMASTRAPQRPLAQLVDVVSGESHSITSAQVTIGRERSVSDIALRDPNVSRRHAQLTFTGSDWSIEDLNSTNGTLVNNRRITRCPLRNGDLLTFGLSTFEFRG